MGEMEGTGFRLPPLCSAGHSMIQASRSPDIAPSGDGSLQGPVGQGDQVKNERGVMEQGVY